ncbi:hypothetical protein L7F22_040265 [Adiantum nelumboides]|nr:hypothetical protein [Adiantum nelumboides]MCO5586326.1 hypothetical protein [Adiantum nelumboides]
MARKEVEVTIVGARELRRVAWFGVNQPVAVAWVKPRAAQSTGVVVDGGAAPFWNQRLLLPVDAHLTPAVAWVLKVQVSHRPYCPFRFGRCCLHRPIGTALIPVSRILSAASSSSSSSASPLLSFPLLGPLNRPQGLLDVTVRLLPVPPSSDSSSPTSPSSSFMPARQEEEVELSTPTTHPPPAQPPLLPPPTRKPPSLPTSTTDTLPPPQHITPVRPPSKKHMPLAHSHDDEFSPYDYQHLYPEPVPPQSLNPYRDIEEMVALYYLSMESHANLLKD